MRISEIVGDAADVPVGEAATGVGPSLPDDWQRRAEAVRREQVRRRKAARMIRDAEAAQRQQQRAAQERHTRADDRIRDLKRQMAAGPAR